MPSKKHSVLISVFYSILCAFLNTATAADETTNDDSNVFITIRDEYGSVTETKYFLQTNIFSEFATIFATNMEPIRAQLMARQTNVSIVDKRWIAPPTNYPFMLTNAAFLAKASEMVLSAETYLCDLKERGRLPGIKKRSHGDFNFDMAGMLNDGGSNTLSYPCVLVCDAVLTDDIFTNHYTVIKPANNFQWHLQRAWQTDLEGNVLTEWPIKH